METTAAAATSDNANAMRREIDRLKADLQRLQSDFTNLAGDAVHAGRAGAAEARERLERGARAAAEKGKEGVEAVQEQVAAHPLVSIATAFAVGMVLGFGLSRKD